MNDIHVISYSTGKVSSLMAEKVFGVIEDKSSIYLVFMDTQWEDDDNYRFMQECINRWVELFGNKWHLVTLTEGRKPLEVARDEHIIPNSLTASCSRRLKVFPFTDYIKQISKEKNVTIYIRYDFSEVHRCEPTKKAYEKRGWNVDFPMLWKPIEFRNYDEILTNDWKINPPRMYSMGYSHANCGGRCVRQGAGDWIKTLINFPERYAEAEDFEREMRKNPKNEGYTFLTRVVDKKEIKITLEELRKEYENDNKSSMWACREFMCVVCGVGDISGGEA